MAAFTATSVEGRVLLALRPHGATLSCAAMEERGINLGQVSGKLLRLGYLAKGGDEYGLTVAGRLACPNRNPLLDQSATKKETAMPKMQTSAVVAALVAAGPHGTTAVALSETLGCKLGAVYFHLDKIGKVGGIYRSGEKGRIAAIEFAPPDTVAAVDDSDDLLPFDLEIPAYLPSSGIKTDPANAAPVAPLTTPLSVAPVKRDRDNDGHAWVLDNPAGTTFWMSSGGTLEIATDVSDSNIFLSREVTAKLLAFLYHFPPGGLDCAGGLR